MDKSTKQYLKDQIKTMSLFGMKYIDDMDKEKIKVICDSILSFETGALISTSEYSLEIVRNISLEVMKMFDREIANVIESSLYFTKVEQVVCEKHLFRCRVNYKYDCIYKGIDTSSSCLKGIKVPNELDECDFIYMGHELVHSQKELNFEEYRLARTLGDVIPLFYEMFASESLIKVAKAFWQSRIEFLKSNAEVYLNSSLGADKSFFAKDLYRVSETIAGQYLNSFYYALILYNMYRNDPSRVLFGIKRVITRDITTLDLLKELGIYAENNDDIVLEEINNIRLLLSK